MGARKKRRLDATADPPEGCHHYAELSTVPWDLQKYFQQRHDIWSRYDEGVWMTDDAWYGVTPEPVAQQIAQHLAAKTSDEKSVLIDGFAGVGGNAIAFAQSGRWKRVYGVEKDPNVLACARHNAQVYGVAHLITWIEGDIFTILQDQLHELLSISVIFASPPWGGPSYRHDEVFDLALMSPYNLTELISPLRAAAGDVVLYLPRTSDVRQLAAMAEGVYIDVIHYCMHGASKAICAYFLSSTKQ